MADAFPEAERARRDRAGQVDGGGHALAQALLDKLANGYIAAEGTGPGNPKIKSGVMVDVKRRRQLVQRQLPRRHLDAPAARRRRVRHRRSPTRRAHTILGAIGNGGPPAPDFGAQLVLGIVTNNNDPEDLGRVRVQYPALGSETEGAWARIATASAGKERGLLMLPVVGEEVLVGFEHGDTTRPYVLGSLFNGSDTPGDDLLHDKDGSFVVLQRQARSSTQAKETYTIKADGDLTIEIGGKVEEKVKGDWTRDVDRQDRDASPRRRSSLEGQSVEREGPGRRDGRGLGLAHLKCGGRRSRSPPPA